MYDRYKIVWQGTLTRMSLFVEEGHDPPSPFPAMVALAVSDDPPNDGRVLALAVPASSPRPSPLIRPFFFLSLLLSLLLLVSAAAPVLPVLSSQEAAAPSSKGLSRSPCRMAHLGNEFGVVSGWTIENQRGKENVRKPGEGGLEAIRE